MTTVWVVVRKSEIGRQVVAAYFDEDTARAAARHHSADGATIDLETVQVGGPPSRHR